MADQDGVDQRRTEFEQVALVYLDSLYNAALRMTGNQPDAEDLVQETYLKAYRFFHRFRKDSNCLAWLFKIMKNSYINRFRQKVREPITVDYETAKPVYELARLESGEIGDSPEEEVFSKLLDDDVERAVRALPDEFRLVVILSDIEGFQYKEIAEILGCPIGTVRSRLSRGRRLLRKQLWDYAKDLGYIKKGDSYGL
ncbi:MAG: sigma-70 family RNA polymerase sigma factor [Candidatus Latescibacteria bacterium]|nr:sigma-70 family RNA polymerase sigma factor [Candidatus Latescibacterota bacterium]